MLLMILKQKDDRYRGLLRQMGEAVEALKDPKGTTEAPARTCKQLAEQHQDYESGK